MALSINPINISGIGQLGATTGSGLVETEYEAQLQLALAKIREEYEQRQNAAQNTAVLQAFLERQNQSSAARNQAYLMQLQNDLSGETSGGSSSGTSGSGYTYSAQQETELSRLRQAIDWINSRDDLSEEEKTQAINAIQAKIYGIEPTEPEAETPEFIQSPSGSWGYWQDGAFQELQQQRNTGVDAAEKQMQRDMDEAKDRAYKDKQAAVTAAEKELSDARKNMLGVEEAQQKLNAAQAMDITATATQYFNQIQSMRQSMRPEQAQSTELGVMPGQQKTGAKGMPAGAQAQGQSQIDPRLGIDSQVASTLQIAAQQLNVDPNQLAMQYTAFRKGLIDSGQYMNETAMVQLFLKEVAQKSQQGQFAEPVAAAAGTATPAAGAQTSNSSGGMVQNGAGAAAQQNNAFAEFQQKARARGMTDAQIKQAWEQFNAGR